ncbi:MAG TPA: glyoxalase [Nocardioides sp.]|nr:glyoxalase [Nocardioides sp.]
MTTSISTVVLEVADVAEAEAFYSALGVSDRVQLRHSEAPTSGFRGFTLSLVVSQPANVDAYISAALDAGGTVLKPAKKSIWGYGGVVQAPDGTIWKFATSSKKDAGPAVTEYNHLVLLLGVDDVKATKQFYADHGLEVGKSFGSKYVEFKVSEQDVQLSLYTRRAAAKDAGVDAEGSGSHRIVVRGDVGPFTDPDGFVWETSSNDRVG